jgi:hypothetical protein
MALKPASSPGLGARLFAPGTPGGLALLRAAWPHAVGPELAQRTEVTGIDRGTLRVRVPDARWRQGLFRMRHRILARLRETAGPVAPDRLGFVEGHVPTAAPSVPEAVAPAPIPPAPAAVVRAAAAIPDPELRARFLETAARYLDRFPPR